MWKKLQKTSSSNDTSARDLGLKWANRSNRGSGTTYDLLAAGERRGYIVKGAGRSGPQDRYMAPQKPGAQNPVTVNFDYWGVKRPMSIRIGS